MTTGTVQPDNSMHKSKTVLEMIGWLIITGVAINVLIFMNWQDKAVLKAIGLIFMMGVSVIGIVCCSLELQKDIKEQEDKKHKLPWKEIRHFVVTGFLVIDAIMILVLTRTMLDSESLSKLWEAKIEWIVALGIVVGILGAVWAVLAKMEASRAFTEAAASKDYALKTYNSIAGAFKFGEILKPSTDFMLPFHLERKHSELILFLGFPAVGFFHRGNKQEPDLLTDALKFCDDLTARLLAMKNAKENPTVRLVLFSNDLTKEYLNKGESDQDKTIKKEERVKYERAENRLHEAIQELNSAGKNFKCAFLEKEIGLRFAISKSINPDEEENEKAIVWVVADFLTNNVAATPELSKFESAGFKSRDPEIIKALRNLCDDYIDHPREGLIKPFQSAIAVANTSPAPMAIGQAQEVVPTQQAGADTKQQAGATEPTLRNKEPVKPNGEKPAKDTEQHNLPAEQDSKSK